MVSSQPRRSGFFRFMMALFLLLACAAAILLLTTRYLQVGEVKVPSVIGSNVDDAQRALRTLGFEVSTYTDASLDAPPGSVTSQTPSADAVVRSGRGIALGVSARTNSAVPGVVGLSQEEAVQTLGAAQLSVSQVALRHAPRPAGTVVSQNPQKGSTVSDTGVSLTVSLGPQAQRVALPRVIGMPLEQAREQLQRLGFRRIEAVPTRLGEPGVNAQRPAPQTRTSVSTQVTLYYTLGNRQIVPVPSILGLDLQAAAERLQAAGLRVGNVTTNPFREGQPSGVSKVEPSDYTLWGTAVDLETNGNAGTYRVGAPALPVALPSTQAGGQRLPQTGSSTSGTSGSIIPQPNNPTGAQTGTQDNPGATASQAQTPNQVTTLDGQPLTLPARGGRTLPITYDPADYSFLQGRAYHFQVQITDAAGERIALDRQMQPDEPVQDTVTVYGEAEMRMYIDGQIVLAYNLSNP